MKLLKQFLFFKFSGIPLSSAEAFQLLMIPRLRELQYLRKRHLRQRKGNETKKPSRRRVVESVLRSPRGLMTQHFEQGFHNIYSVIHSDLVYE